MSAREHVLKAQRALLNDDAKLSYFKRRRITEEAVRTSSVGYESEVVFRDRKGRKHKGPAFAYPCIAKGGGLLGIHYKSVARNSQGKRLQRWGDYANDLLPKGHGKKPGGPAKVVPFGMETLKDRKPGSLVLLCCGEEDALSLRQIGYVAVSQPGAGLLEPVYAKEFAGFEVVVFYDAGEDEEAREDALKLRKAGAKEVRVVAWPPDAPNGADVNGRLVEDPKTFEHWATAMIMATQSLSPADVELKIREGKPDEYVDGIDKHRRGADRGPTQAEILIRYADKVRLFHTPDGEAHATIETDGHEENWPVKSRRFTQFLLREYYEDRGRAPSAQALTDARATIAARAVFDGPKLPVHVRVAGHDEAVYLDLVNDRWEAVEIIRTGWRVLSSDDLPVRFVRKDNAAPLPCPEPGGSVADLRPLLNVQSDEDFILIVGWMVGTFNPDGPYPVLVIQGEQGSAKSTTVRVVRSVVDPAVEPLRAPPRDERDLAIAASGNWSPAVDNLSGIKGWLSDALCRLATGGGFATRELYTDDREIIFSNKRPVILNGIDTLAVAGDLRDRSLIVELPPIPSGKKRTEREFYYELEQVRPKVLGALLDSVSAALRNLDTIELEELPRMADFAVWVAAAEEALPWKPGKFIETYTGNRAEANELALDNDPVAAIVRKFLEGRDEWSGTSTELLTKFGALVDEDTRRSRVWPKTPNALSNRLKRLAPALREVGIEYDDDRDAGGTRARRKHLKKAPAKDRPHRPADRNSPANGEVGAGRYPDDEGRSNSDPASKTVPDKTPAKKRARDGGDGGYDDLHPLSDHELSRRKSAPRGRGHQGAYEYQVGADERPTLAHNGNRPSGCCIHDVLGGCWLCKKYSSTDGVEASSGGVTSGRKLE